MRGCCVEPQCRIVWIRPIITPPQMTPVIAISFRMVTKHMEAAHNMFQKIPTTGSYGKPESESNGVLRHFSL